MKIEKGSKILFQGDSITDAGRDRSDKFGLSGYNKIISDAFEDKTAEMYNRGISGDTTTTLLARIEADLKEIKPDVVSVLIGINDVWRRYDRNVVTSVTQFQKNYLYILEIISSFTKKIILLEPFLIPTDVNKAIFREDLDEKIPAIREIALKFKTQYVPLDGLFAEAAILKGNPSFYSLDSVHLTPEGNAFVANEWLKRIQK